MVAAPRTRSIPRFQTIAARLPAVSWISVVIACELVVFELRPNRRLPLARAFEASLAIPLMSDLVEGDSRILFDEVLERHREAKTLPKVQLEERSNLLCAPEPAGCPRAHRERSARARFLPYRWLRDRTQALPGAKEVLDAIGKVAFASRCREFLLSTEVLKLELQPVEVAKLFRPRALREFDSAFLFAFRHVFT